MSRRKQPEDTKPLTGVPTLKRQDLAWLTPIAKYYNLGGFQGQNIPIRVLNALDSLTMLLEREC